jgi:hypothetical protein
MRDKKEKEKDTESQQNNEGIKFQALNAWQFKKNIINMKIFQNKNIPLQEECKIDHLVLQFLWQDEP